MQLLGWVWEKLAEDNFKTCCEAQTAQGDIGPLCIFSFFYCYCVFLFHLLSYTALPTACSNYVLVHTILCYVGSPSKTSPRYRQRCSRNVLCPIFRVSFHRLIFRPIFERPLYMIKTLRKGFFCVNFSNIKSSANIHRILVTIGRCNCQLICKALLTIG